MQYKITVHVCVDAAFLYTHMYQGLESGGSDLIPHSCSFFTNMLHPVFVFFFIAFRIPLWFPKKEQNSKQTRDTLYFGLKGDNVQLVDLHISAQRYKV